MTDKYHIDPDFVVQEPTAARFFAYFTEEQYAIGEFHPTLDGWRRDGVKQTRVTLVNDKYPKPPYPYGVWFEGWADRCARMLPFGEAERPGGAIYPPLTALAAATGTAETNEDLAQCEASQSGPKGNAQTTPSANHKEADNG